MNNFKTSKYCPKSFYNCKKPVFKAPVLTTQASSDSPKETSGTSTPTTSQPVGLTRSDSLAAVIADLNQTLAMTSVSNGKFNFHFESQR